MTSHREVAEIVKMVAVRIRSPTKWKPILIKQRDTLIFYLYESYHHHVIIDIIEKGVNPIPTYAKNRKQKPVQRCRH